MAKLEQLIRSRVSDPDVRRQLEAVVKRIRVPIEELRTLHIVLRPEIDVSLAEWLDRGGDDLVAELNRLYVPRNDARWLRRNALVAAGNVGPVELAPSQPDGNAEVVCSSHRP